MRRLKIVAILLGVVGLLGTAASKNQLHAQDEVNDDPATHPEPNEEIIDKNDRERKGNSPSAAAISFLNKTAIPEVIKSKMISAISSNLDRTIWIGRIGMQLYVVTTRKLPRNPLRPQARDALVSLVSNMASNTLLQYKALSNYCTANGLSNEDAILDALLRNSGISFSGTLKDHVIQSDILGDYAIAYVIADEASLVVELNDQSSIEIRNAYNRALRRQMLIAMRGDNWELAYQRWNEMQLSDRNTPQSKLDAIHCLVKLEKFSESVALAKEWLIENGGTVDTRQVEKLADEMLSVPLEEGKNLATAAFSIVSDRLTKSSKQYFESEIFLP